VCIYFLLGFYVLLYVWGITMALGDRVKAGRLDVLIGIVWSG
jgi:hypothetical protein